MTTAPHRKTGHRKRGSKSKNTKPELLVRRLLSSLGYRYRVHVEDLPGHPDIAFIKRRKAIFVLGCFWHAHPDRSCPISRMPSSNTHFWKEKFARNAIRHEEVLSKLASISWEALTIWECELADSEALTKNLSGFLGSPRL